MKKSIWVWIGIIIVLIAAGVYAYINYGASADAVVSQKCGSKLDNTRIIIPVGNTAYEAKKVLDLKQSEKADPDGFYIKSGSMIYFTDGMKYAAQPESTSGIIVLQSGTYYLKADPQYGTALSASASNLYVYKNALYSLGSKISVNGNVTQNQGVTMMCGLRLNLEIDIARQGYPIRNAVAVDEWKILTMQVTEKFLDDFFASMPPTGDAARAKVAIESLSAAAKKIVLANSTNGNYSAGLAKFLGINGDAPDKGVTIDGATRNSNGSVIVSTKLYYSGQTSPTLKSFELIMEGNYWRINRVLDVHTQG